VALINRQDRPKQKSGCNRCSECADRLRRLLYIRRP